MFIIGLTGGIGSGKSTVADLFAQHGVPIIDSDVIARQLVRPGQPALTDIAHHFGPDILTEQGELDRQALRARVFTDPQQRRALENILHPPILAEMRRQAARRHAQYCIFVIPLLVECELQHEVDRILAVDADIDIRRQRIHQRDKLSDVDIDAVLASQSSREQRLAAADDVITNNTDHAALARQVEHLHTLYQATASTQSSPDGDKSAS